MRNEAADVYSKSVRMKQMHIPSQLERKRYIF